MHKETSLRTDESKEILVNKIIEKYGELPTVLDIVLANNITNNKEPLLPFCRCKSKGEAQKQGKQMLTLEFVRGLIDGDGSFNVSFVTTRRRINVNFTVVCELSSISVLNDLVDFFSCGTVYKLQSNAARYQVQNVVDMLEKIYPKLKDIKFNTIKQNHFSGMIAACRVVQLSNSAMQLSCTTKWYN